MIPDSGKVILSDETIRLAIEEYLNRQLLPTAQITVREWRYSSSDIVADVTPKEGAVQL